MNISRNISPSSVFYRMKKGVTSGKSILFRLVYFQMLCLLMILPVSAQTLLDPTFNGDGKVTTQIVSFNSKAYDSVLQPDGKIIVVGSANADINFPQSYQIAVARYNPDGSLDTTFDGDGKLTTTPDTSKPSAALAVALQSDGKIVVAGRVGELPPNGSPDAVIVRYNSNGSLDTTFDNDGIRIIAGFNPANSYDIASDAAIQPDGKIIVAAGSIASGFQGFVVARLNSDGAFDTNFGTGGYTRTNFTNSNPKPKVALMADGKIILTGDAVGVKLVRYNSNGLPDASFGMNGVVNNAGGDSIQLDGSGKIITVDNSSQVNTVVRRYNPDGTVDGSFGMGGARSFTFTNADGNLTSPSDLAIQPDGKIVVGGTIKLTTLPDRDFALTRLTASGSIDVSFGFNGQLVTNIQGADISRSIFIQPDGKIVMAGESGGGFTVTRYNSGTLSNTCRPVSDFDGDGKTDLAYFSTSGEWKYLQSSNGGGGTVRWGFGTDRIVPSDYNGDCRTDFAVYRDGIWYIQTSGIGGSRIYYHFGLASDIPVPGDYDGDGLADAAVYRNGIWYVQGTRDGFFAVNFGLADDIPVPGDYDGDGKTDIAVYRAGVWYIQRSQLGFTAVNFGYADDKLVPADYDGDGKTDIAVYRPPEGMWYLQRSTEGFFAIRFGIATDLPIPADYDGDGKADVAVFRNGTWYLQQTTAGYASVSFGTATDKPIPNAFVP